jgi:hypothetical protein
MLALSLSRILILSALCSTLSLDGNTMTPTIEDQIKSMEYGAQFRASIKLVQNKNITINGLLEKIEKPWFTYSICQNRQIDLTEDQFNYLKTTLQEFGGTKAFLSKFGHKISLNHVGDIATLTFEDGIFSPQYNLPSLRCAAALTKTTGTLFDVTSIGLPESLQGRVFISCAHGFREMREDIMEGALTKRFADVPDTVAPENLHKPTYRRYKIQALFYAPEGDISFGILDNAVDSSIFLPPIRLDFEFKSNQVITLAGYGGGNVILDAGSISKSRIHDTIRRAGHQIILEAREGLFGPGAVSLSIDTHDYTVSAPNLDSPLMIPNPGHSGSSALIWNETLKIHEIGGVFNATNNPPNEFDFSTSGIKLDLSDFQSFSDYTTALEAKLTSSAEGKSLILWNQDIFSIAIMEVMDGKIIPYHFEINQPVLYPTDYDTFSDYKKSLLTLLKTPRKRFLMDREVGCSYIKASPYAMRFVKAYENARNDKGGIKGIFKI